MSLCGEVASWFETLLVWCRQCRFKGVFVWVFLGCAFPCFSKGVLCLGFGSFGARMLLLEGSHVVA